MWHEAGQKKSRVDVEIEKVDEQLVEVGEIDESLQPYHGPQNETVPTAPEDRF